MGLTKGDHMSIIFEQLDKDHCPLCKVENWLYYTPALKLTACGECTTRLTHTRVIDEGTIHKTKTQRLVEKLNGTG